MDYISRALQIDNTDRSMSVTGCFLSSARLIFGIAGILVGSVVLAFWVDEFLSDIFQKPTMFESWEGFIPKRSSELEITGSWKFSDAAQTSAGFVVLVAWFVLCGIAIRSPFKLARFVVAAVSISWSIWALSESSPANRFENGEAWIPGLIIGVILVAWPNRWSTVRVATWLAGTLVTLYLVSVAATLLSGWVGK